MIDIDELAAAIVAALKGVIQQGINTGSSFIRSQSQGLAMQAALLTEARVTGQIDQQQFVNFSGQLKALTENFARTTAHLFIITLQNAWNAIVDVLWGTINKALEGAGLGLLAIPKPPKP